MTSSMITGERRWASARRGGMTVLGKVAVPKPINLPSQRLENHGLDPNVEIVPKGTLSWGNRPSSAGSNAWGTLASLPSTDGSSSSSSHVVGRPSSGGGTRPSTAGSEKAHDLNVNVWSSSSRPSSASGVLASNNSSLTSLRPRSAETRPGSSQLSRFAEPSTECSGVWGSSSTSERIGISNSGKDGFSLSSGDFPTLGSEKDESGKNTDSPDRASHRRPGSSSGVTMTENMGIPDGDDIFRNAEIKDSSWKKDGPPYVEDGPRPSMERCYREPHPYQNPNMAPPFYESWRGAPPVNPPGGVWYRGPPAPPPYGTPGAPGGFPMEPFPYYHPQVPAPGLANSQPIPPSGGGPHGHHSKNGDMYRPHMSESYMRPGMPIRPGFYPGPVSYEGYYGPPMRFHNPGERDMPFMGMAAGPPIYNRPVNPNAPDPNNSHSRPSEGRAPDQVEPTYPHDPRGIYNGLRKQNDEMKWGHKMNTIPSTREKGILSKVHVWENAWGDDYKEEEDMHYGKSAPVEEVASQSFENKFGSSNYANLKVPGSVNKVEDANMNSGIIENVASPRDHCLIQKIEGLNAKARASGGRQDGFHREEQIVNGKANQSANDGNSDVLERHHPTGILVPVSRDIHIATVDKTRETVPCAAPAPRRPTRGPQSRDDHYGKGSSNGQEADGWRKKSESHIVVPAAGSGSNINNDHLVGHHPVVHPAEMQKPNIEKKGDGESVMSTCAPSDGQRAKMKEIAKQRAIQLQKEEEERIREQKAKALAKLKELDRRSAKQAEATENPVHRVVSSPPSAHPQEDLNNKLEPMFDANRSTESSSSSANMEAKKTAYQDSVLMQNQLPTADVNSNDAAGHRSAPQVEVSKQKRVVHKPRQNVLPEKSSTQGSIPAGTTELVNDIQDSGATEQVTGGEVASEAGRELGESPHMSNLPVHQRKKNKSGKNKHKVEDMTTAPPLSVAVPQTADRNAFDLNNNSTSENHSSLSGEDAHGRQNNSSKPQHSRKPRNPQGNRSSEKSQSNDAVVWAPVRSHDKVEATYQTTQKAAEPSSVPSATGDNVVLNSPKTKRSEMERYVPKNVAKELAQQGSIQQSRSPSVGQEGIDGTAGRVKTSQGSDYVESKHVDAKHGQRIQGSWRQRVSAESISVQPSRDRSEQTVMSDESFVGEPQSISDEPLMKEPQVNVSDDGWNSVNDCGSTLPAGFAGVKDHFAAGRGKRHTFKGHKGSGSNQNVDHRDSNAPVETSQTERTVPTKENRACHWQPKSQGYVAHNQQGNRSRSGHNGDSYPSSQHNQEDKDVSAGIPNMGHEQNKRDKNALVRGSSHSSNQGPVSEVELGPFQVAEGHNEQRPSSGYRRNANHSSHFSKGHERRGDWSSTAAQENKQRSNSHYEYQPVGPHNNSSNISNESGAQTENQPGGPRVRERGQNHSRRGGGSFYGRQRG